MPARQFTAALGVVKLDLRIERTAKPTAEYLEADALSGLHRNLVVVADFGVGPANNHAGHRHGLCRRLRPVGVHFQDLRQVIDAEQAEVRHAAGRCQPDRVEAEGGVLGHFQADAQLGVVLAVVAVARDGDSSGEAGLQGYRVGKVAAGQGQFHRGAALHAERRRQGNRRRLRIGLHRGGWLGLNRLCQEQQHYRGTDRLIAYPHGILEKTTAVSPLAGHGRRAGCRASRGHPPMIIAATASGKGNR